MSERPVLYVLAGVNGAGKSSIGGRHLLDHGLTWFNPDSFAREYRASTGCGQDDANAVAWREGMTRLETAIRTRRSHAFETTLGGNTLPATLARAAETHDVVVWYCGLASPALHIQRVKERVAAGGHDIPESKIRERCVTSIANLIALLPRLASLVVHDNSAPASPDGTVPDPVLVLELDDQRVVYPGTTAELAATPDWAKPIVEAALSAVAQ